MILGIIGTLGAGKGTVAAYLTKDKSFVYLSVRNFLAAEVLRQGKMVSAETITKAAAELKAAHGEDYITKELLSQTLHEKHDVVVESLRTADEVRYLQTHGAKVWAVEAEPAVRYARLVEGKKEGGNGTLEQFMAAGATVDSGIPEAMKLADAHIDNNGTKAELHARIDAEIQKELTGNK